MPNGLIFLARVQAYFLGIFWALAWLIIVRNFHYVPASPEARLLLMCTSLLIIALAAASYILGHDLRRTNELLPTGEAVLTNETGHTIFLRAPSIWPTISHYSFAGALVVIGGIYLTDYDYSSWLIISAATLCTVVLAFVTIQHTWQDMRNLLKAHAEGKFLDSGESTRTAGSLTEVRVTYNNGDKAWVPFSHELNEALYVEKYTSYGKQAAKNARKTAKPQII